MAHECTPSSTCIHVHMQVYMHVNACGELEVWQKAEADTVLHFKVTLCLANSRPSLVVTTNASLCAHTGGGGGDDITSHSPN